MGCLISLRSFGVTRYMRMQEVHHSVSDQRAVALHKNVSLVLMVPA